MGFRELAVAAGIVFCSLSAQIAQAEIKEGQDAPVFKLKDQNGKEFDLQSRKGKGWTVLYFYPKADSPGCTEQACAFRDTIKRIKAKNAELIGISADDQATQKAFHEKHKLIFDLLSDADLKVIEAYGIKMPILGMAKRWTFIVDPDLKVRSIEPNVDPAFDADGRGRPLPDDRRVGQGGRRGGARAL